MNSIDQAAAEWVARLDGREPTAHERSALDAWLAEDVRHLGALARAEAIATAYEQSVVGARPRSARSPGLNRRWAMMGGLAAGVGVLSVAGAWMTSVDPSYATDRGETRTLAFGDGVRVVLNTETRIRAKQAGGLCRIEPLQGEIMVECRSAPFVVPFQKTRIEGETAAFNLRRVENRAVLTVLGGVVRVTDRDGRGHTLEGGEQVVILEGAMQHRVHLDEAAVARAEAWRSGMIALENATLAEAAAEFGRYNQRLLVVEGRARDERVTGLFAARDPEGFARSVAVISNLSLSVTPERITLSKTAS